MSTRKLNIHYDQSTKSKFFFFDVLDVKKIEALLWGRGKHSFLKKGIDHCEISVTLCGLKKIKKLNSLYRGKSSPTDVLSFPSFENLCLEKKVDERIFLGDIIICKDVAERQARDFNISLEKEFVHLFIHGLLHLLGFDHERNEEDEREMLGLEREWVLNVLNGREL